MVTVFRIIWRWSGGAMVKPGRPTNSDNHWARAYYAFNRSGCGLFRYFISDLSFRIIFFLPLSGRRLDTNRNTVSRGRLIQKQPTNHILL